VITPRQTRLVRVPDLHAFREAISTLCAPPGPLPLVVVPTVSAARQLARSIDGLQAVTRDQLYDRLHACLTDGPRRLTAFERDVMFQAAARAAAGDRRVRPGLVAEIARFYDLLRRQSQQVHRFEELIQERLAGDADTDEGAARMRQQTRFLADAFREYERRVRDSQAVDEHALRERLIAHPAEDPVRGVVVTVADWIADPDGLFVADFDLLTRIPGLERLDIVGTEASLGSGFHERLHNWLPGLDEVAGLEMGIAPAGERPRVLIPGGDAVCFTFRDREEELIDVARRFQPGNRPADIPFERIAVVYKHPLPYLYLAADTLAAAGIPFQSADARPLAAEPSAAVVDLAIDVVASGFTRSAIVALLRSPHLRFVAGGVEIGREHVSALDRELSDARYLGDSARLEIIVECGLSAVATPAGRAALDVARELTALSTADAASVQLKRLLTFLGAHLRPIADEHPSAAREHLARTMLTAGLVALADAHAVHDDAAWTIDELGVAVRRWIEGETFEETPAVGAGLQLLDEVPRARLSTLPRAVDTTEDVPAAPPRASSRDAPAFHGSIGAMEMRPWSISAVETYLGCPFKFFAQHVLKLEEEPDDEEVMDPRAQGQFVHEVFEQFFRAWQDAGRGAITPADLDAARELFTAVVDRAAEKLPGAEAALERTRLLGSPAAAGLGDAVFRMEAERPIPVVERLLEHKLDGEFTIATEAGTRTVRLRGKADRIDLLGDGTFRLIDYKLGWPPDRRRALQLPIYGVCAEQRLAGRHNRTWTLGEAAYLAFKGPRRVVPLFQTADASAEILAAAEQRLADALDAIGRGEFPPTPDDVHRCETCAFASVCRKDYVGDV